MGVTIFRGLHSHLRPQAARLYWEAFGGKLGRVLGPDDRALVYFEKVIRSDLCFVAVDENGPADRDRGLQDPFRQLCRRRLGRSDCDLWPLGRESGGEHCCGP